MGNTRKRLFTGGSNKGRLLSSAAASAASASAASASAVADALADKQRFDLPRHVFSWLDEKEKINQKMFFYGLGMILKDKEEEMGKKIVSIKIEIEKLTNEYKKNEENYQALLENDNAETSEMKEDMQEKVRENLNIPYQTRYSELIQKKQSYDIVMTSIKNRRWYLAYTLQKEDEDPTKDNEMISEIKNAVTKIYSTYRGNKYAPIRTKLFSHLKTLAYSHSTYKNSFALNASITGPAGSGKTTLAREMAQWLSKIGLLTYDAFFEDKRGKLSLIETGRSGLIAEYTGQTAPKTLGVLVRSLERTLFIDEAYSVAGCSFDTEGKIVADSYGEEFLAELLRFMNDHKGFTSLIVAGYDNLMKKCFFARNEGLPRRFPDQISLPFYSTDELFAIFTSTVVKKSQSDILVKVEHIKNLISKGEKAKNKGLVSEEQFQEKIRALEREKITAEEGVKKLLYTRFSYLSVIKPSFLMVHFDTSYDGINTLRKYLTIFQIRSAVQINKIYSWTILNHLLTNLLGGANDDGIRKHLFRKIFYEQIFNFTGPNLSYFPAQAGEMENLADDCSKRIAPELKPDNLFVQPEREMSLINDYCKGKKIRVEIQTKTEVNKMISEKTGLTQKQEKQKIYVDEYRRLNEMLSKIPKKAENLGFTEASVNLNGLQIKTTKGQIEARMAKLKALIKTTGAANTATAKIQVLAALSEESFAYELCLLTTDIADMRRRIHDFLELDSLFGNGIPNVEELWAILKDETKRNKLIEHMVNLYVDKVNPDFIEDILSQSETDFPIHLNKQSLELEYENFKNKVDIDESVESGDSQNVDEKEKRLKVAKWDAFKKSLSEKIKNEYEIIAADYSGVVNYAHKDFAKWSARETLGELKKDIRSNILFEDLGIKEE